MDLGYHQALCTIEDLEAEAAILRDETSDLRTKLVNLEESYDREMKCLWGAIQALMNGETGKIVIPSFEEPLT